MIRSCLALLAALVCACTPAATSVVEVALPSAQSAQPCGLVLERRYALSPGRYGAAAAGDATHAYIVGGSSSRGLLGRVERLEVATGQWLAMPVELEARRYHGAAIVGEWLYVVGGEVGGRKASARFERVHTKTFAHESLPDFPWPRRHVSVVGYGGRLIVAGGRDDGGVGSVEIFNPETGEWDQVTDGNREGDRIGRVDTYDPEARSWSLAPALPKPRDAVLVSAADSLFALGGYIGTEEAVGVERVRVATTVERLDAGSDAWLTVADMLHPTSAFSAGSVDDVIYTFGDYDNHGLVQRFNPATESWTELATAFTPRRHSAAAVVGDRLVVAGGNVASGGSHIETVEVFHVTACP